MNKNAIQRYAIWARKELIAQVSQRAYQYGIDADGYGDYDALTVAGRTLSNNEKKQRQQLITLIRSKGYTKVMEEVAYTWFNRFIALRFMEVNNYLPTHIRVFSDASGAFKPEILSNALHLDLPGLDMEKVSDLIEENQTEDLYRYLLLIQCNAFNPVMPRMFEPMGSYTELLLPNNILRPDGVLGRLVTDIPQEDWTDQVQIIGWMYQYYNKEEKERVFADLKKNIKVRREDIPAATQLFTPDWIVRYMVENSLGRLWAEGHPKDELKQNWKYYLEEAAQEPAVQAQLENIRAKYQALRPEEIRCIDPCMGSGHILAYLFDVLMQIYTKYGYTSQEAVKSIIERNLYGLDIDGRAEQLAYFTVMMKARQYDRRFLTRKKENGCPDVPQPVVYSTISVPGGDEYGSLLTFDDPGSRPEWVAQTGLFEESEAAWYVKHLLSQKYHVVVTNPPYMGSGNMNSSLADFVKSNYPDSKSDLSTAFMEKTLELCTSDGYMAMINIPVWMFLSSFEKLREKILKNYTYISMVHPGRGIFGSDFGTTIFVIAKQHISGYKGSYRRLFDAQGEVKSIEEREAAFLAGKGRFVACQDNFSKIPGSPIAYWVSKRFIANFAEKRISDIHFSGGRNKTHNNEIYTRYWWEVSDTKRWQKYVKGGDFRRWYGNHEFVVDWSDSAKKEYDSHGGLYNQNFANKTGICWTLITSAKTTFRVKISSAHYDSAAPTIFNHSFTLDTITLGFLNSNVATTYLSLLNPTINMGNTYVLSLPYLDVGIYKNRVDKNVNECIAFCRTDWDAFETSWDFQRHPLVRGVSTVRAAYEAWARECDERFAKLKANEEELNRIFIDIYGLQDELTPEVEDKDVTVRRADLGRDIRSLISYAVGCMFGRYSLDEKGLILAGQPFSDRFAYASASVCGTSVTGASSLDSVQGDCYLLVPGEPIRHCTYAPDPDNVLPICDDEYFEDDIVGKFVAFVRTVYGENTLEENLRFIADALGGKGTPRDVIRNYFLNDFYADHLKTYQKRPIYWLFDSGKKNGFKALVYMHRYQSDLLARLRTDYVHEQQERYRTQLRHIGDAMDSAAAPERVKLAKQQKKLQEQALELQKYEEMVHHLADQYIKIDLDDGVKHNYALFADVLARI